jgi:two-component system, chemotaxis family, response regulator Rcp1
MIPAYTDTDILLVEDNPGDIRLMKEAFFFANSMIRLHVVPDGVEAMAFLRNEGLYRRSPRPDVILLDLNLPKMGGHEVLSQIKGDARLRSIPTVVLSSSEMESDIWKSYQLHANSYLKKPQELGALEGLAKSITEYWLNRARLPPPRWDREVLSEIPIIHPSERPMSIPELL